MCKNLFEEIYEIAIANGAERSLLVEKKLGLRSPISPTRDAILNERESYAALFGNECSHLCEGLLMESFSDLKNTALGYSNEIFDSLILLQFIFARAMWKYNIDLEPSVEKFTKEYDRLDVFDEKKRLWEFVRK
jgi:hypothetical protein